MNVLFLTLLGFDSVRERNIYTDLLREFAKNGHQVFAVSPVEKRFGQDTHLIEEENATVLRLRIGNTQKTNIIEKGISTVMIGPTFKKAIKNYFPDVKFDLILYSTPPITLVSVVEYVKKRDGSKTYLLLKDIFPQNAVDIGLMSKKGLKGSLYNHFRKQEKRLYGISDYIGCMSQANVEYVINHNREVDPQVVEVCPNSIEVIDKSVDTEMKKQIRVKYGIPEDKKVLVYGGNLGKPQDIPFLIDCLKQCETLTDAFFLIVGAGTEFPLLQNYAENEKPRHVKLMKHLPKEDYDTLISACDAGLICLDHRFTIPNFPSRILSYMQAKLPVVAITDPNTDIGKVITDGEFGVWCESSSPQTVEQTIAEFLNRNLESMGEKAFDYLMTHYSSAESYNIITKRVGQ